MILMADKKHKEYYIESPKPRGRGGMIAAVIVIIILLLAIICGGLYWYFCLRTPSDNMKEEPNAVIGIMPGEDEDAIRERLQKQIDEKTIAFEINSAPVFDTGTSKGNIMFNNPQNNGKKTRLEIYRDDTGEIIYKTGIMNPGSYVETDKLDENLPGGVYQCTAYIYAYKLDGGDYIGKVAAGLELTVLN